MLINDHHLSSRCEDWADSLKWQRGAEHARSVSKIFAYICTCAGLAIYYCIVFKRVTSFVEGFASVLSSTVFIQGWFGPLLLQSRRQEVSIR